MAQIPDALERLRIERECEQLSLKFAAYVDSHEHERLLTILTPQALFVRPTEPDQPIRGAEAIVASYRRQLTGYVAAHLCTNILIEVESAERARGTTRILFFAAEEKAPAGPTGRVPAMQRVGEFQDVFVRTGDGWRIAERRSRLIFTA